MPAGAQHLDTAIACKAPFSGAGVVVYLGLIDPYGHDTAYTVPQGFTTGYGHFDVVNPAPGTWTAVFWTPDVGASDATSAR